MLDWTTIPYTFSLIVSGLVALACGLYAARHRATRGAGPFMWLALAVAEWAFAYALEVDSADPAWQIFWAKVEYLGVAFGPLFWLAFALQYTRHEQWVS